jgi:hypothetical protein
MHTTRRHIQSHKRKLCMHDMPREHLLRQDGFALMPGMPGVFIFGCREQRLFGMRVPGWLLRVSVYRMHARYILFWRFPVFLPGILVLTSKEFLCQCLHVQGWIRVQQRRVRVRRVHWGQVQGVGRHRLVPTVRRQHIHGEHCGNSVRVVPGKRAL